MTNMNYVEAYSGIALMSVHVNQSCGSLLWMGNRAEDETNVRSVIATLCYNPIAVSRSE